MSSQSNQPSYQTTTTYVPTQTTTTYVPNQSLEKKTENLPTPRETITPENMAELQHIGLEPPRLIRQTNNPYSNNWPNSITDSTSSQPL